MRRTSALLTSGALVLAACSGSEGVGEIGGVTGSTTDAATASTDAATAPIEGTPIEGTPIEGTDAVVGVRFYPIAITDPASEGIVAFTFLAPEGWNYEGSVVWSPQFQHLADLRTTVSDPVTGVTIDYLPIMNFIWFTPPAGFEVPEGGNYQGKTYLAPIGDPLEFVQRMWMGGSLAHLAAADVIGVVETPAVAEEFVLRFGATADARAYRIRYGYERDGVRWEEDVSFALLYAGSSVTASWYVNFASTVRAPAGELDRQASTIGTVMASRVSTPEWEANYRIVQQLFTQGIQQQLADTAALTALFTQYRAESQALQQQVVAERQASQDRIADVFRETLGGVQSYVDPVAGGLVQLPLGFDTYWVNEQGEYLAVGDPGFDPNTLNDGTWQQLAPR